MPSFDLLSLRRGLPFARSSVLTQFCRNGHHLCKPGARGAWAFGLFLKELAMSLFTEFSMSEPSPVARALLALSIPL